ncbi:type IV pilus modification protein PilV [Pseudomonas floridensis]|uniref:Type IV pilus modification protein PilV n=1 Tax=Pseudomonas floridensis TaxID=1958950 RepID=A0A1X0NCS7_9PSED|nr:type IV pilus modification protein PilV [Pseudomonas floridensis]ORC61561.1 type IV pilus modification protein PilV [Pseudomonas floridensis]
MILNSRHRQRGMTLIEVLVSVLILAIGLLGAAAIQLNALKYTDSAAMTSQASFIAYDMMDRIRANVDGNAAANPSGVLATYSLNGLGSAPVENLNVARDQDLADFKKNINNFAGSSGTGVINVANAPEVTITITWNDTRAASASNVATTGNAPTTPTTQTFTLTSRIGVNP